VGKAYFEVAEDPSKKFVITGGGMTTEVLGTHFNMNTYPNEVAKKVTLLGGRLKVSGRLSNSIIRPG